MKRCTSTYRAIVGLFALSLVGCTALELDAPDDSGLDAGPDGDADMSGAGMSGSDGGPVDPPERVRPSATRFSTVGQSRSGGGLTLRDDGFESGARQCARGGSFCVTGGFEP